MSPAPTVQSVLGRPRDVGPDAQCRGERRHRVEASVEPEHEFVELGRTVLCTHTVVRTEQLRVLLLGTD
jgi:hypothetical protein